MGEAVGERDELDEEEVEAGAAEEGGGGVAGVVGRLRAFEGHCGCDWYVGYRMGWFLFGVECGGGCGCGLMGCGCGVRLWIFGGSELAAGASPGTTEMDILYRELRGRQGDFNHSSLQVHIVDHMSLIFSDTRDSDGPSSQQQCEVAKTNQYHLTSRLKTPLLAQTAISCPPERPWKIHPSLMLCSHYCTRQ